MGNWVTGWLSHWMTESLIDWLLTPTDTYWHLLPQTDTYWQPIITRRPNSQKWTRQDDKTTRQQDNNTTNSETKKRSCYERLIWPLLWHKETKTYKNLIVGKQTARSCCVYPMLGMLTKCVAKKCFLFLGEKYRVLQIQNQKGISQTQNNNVF